MKLKRKIAKILIYFSTKLKCKGSESRIFTWPGFNMVIIKKLNL